MKHDYMGYGDIYGGLFDNNIFGEQGLSFKLFFESEADNISKNFKMHSNKTKVRKLVPEKLNKQEKVICVNC